MTKEDIKQELFLHEWVAVLVLSFVLIGIGLLSYLNSDILPDNYASEPWVPEIYVTVTGAVDNPGKYFVKEESILNDLIPQLIFSSDADKTLLKLDKPLKNGQKIKIPSTQITVIVEGELNNPGEFKLDRMSRFSDLVKELDLKENADRSKLKSRRKLKDREKIQIYSRK
jgi:DNA uptake protein ComE-like DNA-binding protein